MCTIDMCAQCPTCLKVLVPEQVGATERGPVLRYECDDCGVEFKKEVRSGMVSEGRRRVAGFERYLENGEAA